jgi:hypothetical protein
MKFEEELKEEVSEIFNPHLNWTEQGFYEWLLANIRLNCIDKQKVKDAISHLKVAVSDDWKLWENDISNFEKELGL